MKKKKYKINIFSLFFCYSIVLMVYWLLSKCIKWRDFWSMFVKVFYIIYNMFFKILGIVFIMDVNE